MIAKFFCIIFLVMPLTAYAGGADFSKTVAVENALNFVEQALEAQGQFIEPATFQTQVSQALINEPVASYPQEYPPSERNYPQDQENNYPPAQLEQDLTRQDVLTEEEKFVSEIQTALRAIFGEKARATFGLGLSQILGQTAYHISFDNPFDLGGHGESELEWPIKNTFFTLTSILHYRQNKDAPGVFARDQARFDFAWFTKFDDRDGVMRDSDWIENDVGFLGGGYQQEGKDIFSKSTSKLKKADIINLAYTYNFWPYEQLSIGPQLGYRFSRFEFSAYNLNQVGYGPYATDYTFRDSRNLEWGTYTQEQSIPYMGFSSECFLDKFFMHFNFGFSKWAQTHGEDIHLYPTADEALGYNVDMVSKGSTKGSAILWGIEGGWNFHPKWLFNLGVNYIDIFTKGVMSQTYKIDGEDIPIGDVGEKVTSEYWQINTSIKYLF